MLRNTPPCSALISRFPASSVTLAEPFSTMSTTVRHALEERRSVGWDDRKVQYNVNHGGTIEKFSTMSITPRVGGETLRGLGRWKTYRYESLSKHLFLMNSDIQFISRNTLGRQKTYRYKSLSKHLFLMNSDIQFIFQKYLHEKLNPVEVVNVFFKKNTRKAYNEINK